MLFTFALGTAAGDLLAATEDRGLGLGTSATSVIFLAVILVLVTVLSIRQRRQRQAHEVGVTNDALLANGRDADLAVAP